MLSQLKEGETKEYMTVDVSVESMVREENAWDARVVVVGFIIENLERCITGCLVLLFSKRVPRRLEFCFGE